jgi:hypothetical protein
LENHYAIIFACREWVPEPTNGGEIRKQILTARRGQKPADWIDWDHVTRGSDEISSGSKSVLSTLRAWHGHCILQFELIDGKKCKARSINPDELEIMERLRNGKNMATDLFGAVANDWSRGELGAASPGGGSSDDESVEPSR